jgi:hypothetical protein
MFIFFFLTFLLFNFDPLAFFCLKIRHQSNYNTTFFTLPF